MSFRRKRCRFCATRFYGPDHFFACRECYRAHRDGANARSMVLERAATRLLEAAEQKRRQAAARGETSRSSRPASSSSARSRS